MIAVVFPGQGSQRPGMGRDLDSQTKSAQDVFEEVSQATGTDLRALCFEADEETLRRTDNAQLALYTCGLAAWAALRERFGRDPSAFAGHSVGEYAAVVAAGALGVADGALLVQERGRLMAACGTDRPGGMAAVLGMDRAEVEQACTDAGGPGVCVVANDNSPGQVVVSGDLDAVQRASALLVERGAKRVLPLNVSGAFHSPLMADASASLGEALRAAPFDGHTQKVPVYANVTASPVSESAAWPGLLERQLVSPVRWAESVVAMARDGVTTVVECGVGEVLGGLVKRTVAGVRTLRVVDLATLDETLSQLAEVPA